MLKNYKAIFFDWDGTAVLSRKASADTVAVLMKQLLHKGVKLVVISGTTIENIGEGRLHEYFTVEERKHLFYGLGRGALNYRFDEKGEPEIFRDSIPKKEEQLQIHKVCYLIHETLYQDYNLKTDIVFSRPNYCKIDLMTESSRGDHLFFQASELERLLSCLKAHGINQGVSFLLDLADRIAGEQGMKLLATTDAKYLEVGPTSKSDNVDCIMTYLNEQYGLQAEDCAFWGDEYVGMGDEIFGSDSFMITEQTKKADFFDVSDAPGKRPKEVQVLGGGVKRFHTFLQNIL